MTNTKAQMTKEIQITNNKNQNKKFDLEDRTLRFAKGCIDICKVLVKDDINLEIEKQLIRASTSVGANYREANDTITKRDFHHRISICRRESKESKYWLELLSHSNVKFLGEIKPLIDEALQLAKIFASISKNKS